jgi:hypothetical protein
MTLSTDLKTNWRRSLALELRKTEPVGRPANTKGVSVSGTASALVPHVIRLSLPTSPDVPAGGCLQQPPPLPPRSDEIIRNRADGSSESIDRKLNLLVSFETQHSEFPVSLVSSVRCKG